MNRKIKVLVITNSFPTVHNKWAAVFILNQLEYLKNTCEFKVINPYAYVPKIRFFNPFYRFSQVPFKEKIIGIEVYRPRYAQISRFFLFNSLLRSMAMLIESINIYFNTIPVIKDLEAKWKFDLIHLHGPISEGMLGVYTKKKWGIPLVITFHGEDVTKLSKMRFLKFSYRNTLKNCDALIFVTDYLRKELGEKFPSKKIFIAPCGYTAKRFKVLDQNKCRRALNLKKRKKIVLFVGGLVERKGVEYLIRAMSLVSKKRNDVSCYVVGDGKLMEKLKMLSHELNLGDFVHFAGQQHPDKIPLWMNASDLFVLPSLNEGMPSVVAEAMACGKPVVATDVAGIPDILSRDTGFLVEPKNYKNLASKILVALGKRWNRKLLINRAKKFSIEKSTKKIYLVYKRIIS